MKSKIKGLTVGEVIARLQQCDPNALIVTDAGEGTVSGVQNVWEGCSYQFINGPTYGMSEFNFIAGHEKIPTKIDSVKSVFIG